RALHLCARLWKNFLRRSRGRGWHIFRLDDPGKTRLSSRRSSLSSNRALQWTNLSITVSVLAILSPFIGCANHSRFGPQAEYAEIERVGLQGNLTKAQSLSEQAYRRFAAKHNVEWAWRFRVLDAQYLLWQGRNADSLALLAQPLPDHLAAGDL